MFFPYVFYGGRSKVQCLITSQYNFLKLGRTTVAIDAIIIQVTRSNDFHFVCLYIKQFE